MSRAPCTPPLRLRRWALRVFAGGPCAPVPAASPATWAMFLRAERCALPLRARVAGPLLDAGARGVLEAFAHLELQRALSLRAELNSLGRLLRRGGWMGIALKSGADAARGGGLLDASDVDLLVRLEDVRAVAAALDREGTHTVLSSEEFAPSRVGVHHLAARFAPGSIPVEIHYKVPLLGDQVDPWRGALPTRVPGVYRLAAGAHLWHVLVHGVSQHIERRGVLRDLLMLQAALEECTEAEVGWVERQIAHSPDAAALTASLALARSLSSGDDAGDPFQPIAALRMRLALLRTPCFAGPLSRAFLAAAFALAAGGTEYRRLWRGSHASVLVGPEATGDRRLDRVPVLAWPLRVASRGLHLAAATPFAWAFARRARRSVAWASDS